MQFSTHVFHVFSGGTATEIIKNFIHRANHVLRNDYNFAEFVRDRQHINALMANKDASHQNPLKGGNRPMIKSFRRYLLLIDVGLRQMHCSMRLHEAA